MSNFIENIISRAKADKKRIVLPESYDPRVVEAASRLLQREIAEIILIGDKEKIQAVAPEWTVDEATFIDPAQFAEMDQYANQLYELRKAKGMTLEEAQKQLQNPTVLAIMLVKNGEADGVVAGAVNSTADTLRPALQILKTKPGTKLVSSFFIMVVPNCEHGAQGTFLFADCGLNIKPNAQEMAEIAVSSASSFKALTGEEPIIAMTSYSSQGSGKGEDVDKVREATQIAKELAPELHLDGELQIDAALVEATGKKKAPNSTVQGNANCLIFPDINAGNISYKLVQYLAKAEAYGPMLQGIAKPVNDLSRGCSADDIVGVVAITAVQAQDQEA